MPPSVTNILRSSPGGIATNTEILRGGFTSWHLTAWVRAGLLERPALGLYALPGTERTAAHRVHLAHRYLVRRQRNFRGEDRRGLLHLLSGPGVLQLHGLTDLSSCEVIALIPHGRRVRPTDAPFTIRHADLTDEIPCVVTGLQVARPARAVGDHAAGQVPDAELRHAVDRLRWMGMEIVPAVQQWRETHGRGFRRLARMASAGVFEQESDGERDLFRQIQEGGLPLPDCQVWLSPSTRVDFAYLDAGFVLEYHGVDAHRDRVDEDAVRGFEVLQRGYDTMVVTKSMVGDPALLRVIDQRRRRGIRDIREGRRAAPSPPLRRPRLTPLRTLPNPASDARRVA